MPPRRIAHQSADAAPPPGAVVPAPKNVGPRGPTGEPGLRSSPPWPLGAVSGGFGVAFGLGASARVVAPDGDAPGPSGATSGVAKRDRGADETSTSGAPETRTIVIRSVWTWGPWTWRPGASAHRSDP